MADSEQAPTKTAGRTKYVFFIDKKKYETDEPQLTVGELLRDFAHEDHTESSLALRQGNDFEKYEDTRTEVDLTSAPHFVIFHNTPTPVS